MRSDVKLFIDDVRNHEPGDSMWVTIRNYGIAIKLIDAFWYDITEISLDHDLGTPENGYDIMKHIEETVYDTNFTYMPNIRCHSMNPVGRRNILAMVAKLESQMKGRCRCREIR